MSRKVYKQTVTSRRSNAASISAGAAWEFVKEHMGAITLIGELGNKQIPLLQDTHRLIESLEPAPLHSDGSYSPINADQVVAAGPLLPPQEPPLVQAQVWGSPSQTPG